MPCARVSLSSLLCALALATGCASSGDPAIHSLPVSGPLTLRVTGWTPGGQPAGQVFPSNAAIQLECDPPAGLTLSEETPYPLTEIEIETCEFTERSYHGDSQYGYSYSPFTVGSDGLARGELQVGPPPGGLSRLERFEARIDLVFYERKVIETISDWRALVGKTWTSPETGAAIDFLEYSPGQLRFRVRAATPAHVEAVLVGIASSTSPAGSEPGAEIREVEFSEPHPDQARIWGFDIQVTSLLGARRYQGVARAGGLKPSAAPPR